MEFPWDFEVPTIDLDWELIEVDCALLLRYTLTRCTKKQRDWQQNVKSNSPVHCHECKSAKLKRVWAKTSMEMTVCGKHGKPRSRLTTLPIPLGNPSGISHIPTATATTIINLKTAKARRKPATRATLTASGL